MQNSECTLFKELAHIFSQRKKENQVIEFEILEPAHALTLGPLVQDGWTVGISKKALVQAFAIARPIFFEYLVSMTENDMLLWSDRSIKEKAAAVVSEKGGNNVSEIAAGLDVPISVVTEIILLFDCEYVTACNWRKRRIMSFFRDSTNKDATRTRVDEVINMLETELTLMTTYTCSPLHRHTKSPTLWQHRLWVWVQWIEVNKRKNAKPLGLQDVQELLRAELKVVLRAGELHPRNYYAFAYLRRLYIILIDNGLCEKEKEKNSTTKLARSMLNSTLDWCLSHPQDISGWSFTFWLLEALTCNDQDIRIASIERVVQFALNVGWEGESLWTFVDLSTRAFGLVEIIQNDTLLGDPEEPSSRPWKTWLSRAKTYWGSNVK